MVAPFEGADDRRAVVQLTATVLPFLALLAVMYRSLVLPYGLTLLLAVPTAGFLVRVFMVMHDCGHGSFFRSRRANDVVGFAAGVLTLTPYIQWRRDHALHHASAGDLDRRGHGDVLTLTTLEYGARSRWGRLAYRLYRHPAVMFGLGPLHLATSQRHSPRGVHRTSVEGRSIRATNVAIILVFGVARHDGRWSRPNRAPSSVLMGDA